MLGLDTNILVRFLVRDDESQFQKANRLIKREVNANEGLPVSLIVLLKMECVLRSRYRLSKVEIFTPISALLETEQPHFEDEAAVEEALHFWKDSSVDFADCLIASRNCRLGCRTTMTFDSKAVKLPAFTVL